jgi:RNA polymerase sigma factor (sigma-70 family)
MPTDSPANLPSADHHEGIDAVELFSLCAKNTADSELWTEFLRRYTHKIKAFIRGSLCQSRGDADSRLSLGEIQESDLFQNVIVRLVKNDCAAMKQFSGKREDDLLAYMAVITRSVVRDCQRSQWALKRASDHIDTQHLLTAQLQNLDSTKSSEVRTIERRLLAREVVEISKRTLKFLPRPYSARDRLIFQLYFRHDLSAEQITRCKGINLSKAGVEKVLNRLKERIRAAASARPGAEVGL